MTTLGDSFRCTIIIGAKRNITLSDKNLDKDYYYVSEIKADFAWPIRPTKNFFQRSIKKP